MLIFWSEEASWSQNETQWERDSSIGKPTPDLQHQADVGSWRNELGCTITADQILGRQTCQTQAYTETK